MKTITIKPVRASEIRDPRLAYQVVADMTREKTPEEWTAIETRRKERQELLKKAMTR